MDMWRPYFDSTKKYFKNAKIVIDIFHFIRQAVQAIENIRKRIQKQLSKNSRIFFKHSKKLLMKNPKKLTLEEIDELYAMVAHSEDL